MAKKSQPENGHSQTVAHAEESAAAKPGLKLTADQLNLSAIEQTTDLSVAAVKEVVTGIPIKTSSKDQFIRSKLEYALTFTCICKKSADEMTTQWLIIPEPMLPYAPTDLLQTVTFVPYVTREDSLGAWPLKHPSQGRVASDWFVSAGELLKVAGEKWVAVSPGMGRYNYRIAEGITKKPKWPEGFSKEKFYEIGLQKFVVTDSADSTLAALRGDE